MTEIFIRNNFNNYTWWWAFRKFFLKMKSNRVTSNHNYSYDNKKSYYLEKEFKFRNFIQSQNFVNKVGLIAELEGHHPDINFGWGYTKVKIFTHAIKGLAESDFILAAKIDQI